MWFSLYRHKEQNAVVFQSDQVIHTQICIVCSWLLVLGIANPGLNSPKLLQMIYDFRLIVELKHVNTTFSLNLYLGDMLNVCVMINMLITDCTIPN